MTYVKCVNVLTKLRKVEKLLALIKNAWESNTKRYSIILVAHISRYDWERVRNSLQRILYFWRKFHTIHRRNDRKDIYRTLDEYQPNTNHLYSFWKERIRNSIIYRCPLERSADKKLQEKLTYNLSRKTQSAFLPNETRAWIASAVAFVTIRD